MAMGRFFLYNEQAISRLLFPSAAATLFMETRRLGTSDLKITPFGIGAWPSGGGGWNGGMGPQNESDSIPVIPAALDHGLNWIDPAALHGLGHSETVVARALAGRSPRPYVFTKCERVSDARGAIGACSNRKSIRREYEDGLRRVQTEVIGLYQIHGPNPTPISKKGGRRWPGCKEKTNFATSEFRTLVSPK